MDATDQIVSESFRIVRAQERLSALLRPLGQLTDMIDAVLEEMPELAPEMNEIRGRIVEVCDHLRSSAAVIQAKVDLL